MKKHASLIVQIFLGLIFFIFGLNGFLNFIPPQPMPGPAGTLMEAFVSTGYMFPLIKGTEVICGALLLSNFYAPLALILLAPVIVNIVLFHTFLVPSGFPMALILVLCESFLAWTYRKTYAPLFKPKPNRA